MKNESDSACMECHSCFKTTNVLFQIIIELGESVNQQQLLVKFTQDLVSVVAQKAAALPDNEHLLSGQLEEMSLDVTVLVFDKDDITATIACR